MKAKLSLLVISLIIAGCGGSDNDSEDQSPVNNTPPTISNSSVETLNGNAVTIDLTPLVADVDKDTITIDSVGNATNGTITTQGMTLTFDPDDNYAGTDSFSVSVTDGKASASATISIAAYQGVTIKGKVVDEPVPNALVNAIVGGQEFNATADENGVYSLDVKTLDLSQFVTITATGAENNSNGIKLINMLGEVNNLIATAGDERTLAKSTNVTNMTSARYVLAKEANDGAEIRSNAQLTQAEKSIDATKLLEIAAVIKVILDNPNYNLPEGFNNVLDFVANSEAYNTFVDDVTAANPDDNPLTQAMKAISEDPELTQGFTADTLSLNYIIATASAPGFLSRGGDLMTLASDGKGSLTNDNSQRNFTWSLTEGKLSIVFETPLTSYGFYSIHDVLPLEQANKYVAQYGSSQVGGTRSTKSQTYIRLVDGNEIDTSSVTTVSDLTYDSVSLDGVPIAMPNLVNDTSPSEELMRDLSAITPLAITTVDLEDIQAVPTYYNSSYGLTYNGDLLEFNADGSGNAVLSERSFQWQLADNTVNISFSDNTRLVAQKLDELNELSALALKTYNADGQLIAFSYNFSTWQDEENGVLTAEKLSNMSDHFWATFVNGWMARYWKNDVFDFVKGSGFGFQFHADNTLNTFSYYQDLSDEDQDGNTDEIMLSTVPGTWSIGTEDSENVLSFTRCYEPEYCQRREWLGLHASSSELIVIERAYNPDDNGGEYLLIPPRINIYRDWQELPKNSSNSGRKSFSRSSSHPIVH